MIIVPAEPDIPANLSATADDGEVTVTWSPVSGATSYRLYWLASANCSALDTDDARVENAVSPHTHTGLANGTRYCYAVAAGNAGGESALSAAVSATPVPPPAAPANLSVTGGNSELTLRWDPVSGASTYNLYWLSPSNGQCSMLSRSNGTRVTGVTSPHVRSRPARFVCYAVTAVGSTGERVT